MADGKPVFTPEQQAQIDAQVSAAVKATVEALKAIQPDTADLHTNKTRQEAERRARPHHWRAFRSSKGAIGVAYITESNAHKTGRVIKFDEYILPPEEQRPAYNLAKFHAKTGEPLEPYKTHLWFEFVREDTNAFGGQDASLLPDAGPPRATFEEALEDLSERELRRDEEFRSRAKASDQTVVRSPIPLPATVPAKKKTGT